MESCARSLPKISIVIPSYNQVQFLRKALDSLRGQEYPHLEVIVVDGASTDQTVELLRDRRDIVSRWVSEPDAGQTQALNKGFRMATGEVLGWLNCDERYRPGALRLVGETFAGHPELEMVFGHRKVVDARGREIGSMKTPAIHPRNYALFASGLLFSDATFWTTELHQRTGQLDEANYPRYAMDVDWFARLGLQVKKWRRLDAYLSEFTEHEERVSQNVPEMAELTLEIRRRVMRLAGVKPLRVILYSPLYFVLSRYGRFGWRGLLKPPCPTTIFRFAGLIK